MLDLKHGQESGERLYGDEQKSSSERLPAAHEGGYAIAQTFAALLPMLRAVRIDLRSVDSAGASIMGKYVLGWFMGVPVFVLVILYLIFH